MPLNPRTADVPCVKTREGRKRFLSKSIPSYAPCTLCRSWWRRFSVATLLAFPQAGDTAIVAGRENSTVGRKNVERWNSRTPPPHRHREETERALAGSCSARQPSAATLNGRRASLTSLLPSPSVHPRSTAAPRRSPAHPQSPGPDARPRAAPRTAATRVPCSSRRTNPYSFPNPRRAWP
jgi:hypothetical protein